MKLARIRGAKSQSTADTLTNPTYNAMQATTTLLGNYTKSEGFGTKFAGLT